jgi:hypothetical protein
MQAITANVKIKVLFIGTSFLKNVRLKNPGAATLQPGRKVNLIRGTFFRRAIFNYA